MKVVPLIATQVPALLQPMDWNRPPFTSFHNFPGNVLELIGQETTPSEAELEELMINSRGMSARTRKNTCLYGTQRIGNEHSLEKN